MSLLQEAEVEDKCGATCDRPDNMFHSKHSLTYAPEGMRLDYLLYQTNLGVHNDAGLVNPLHAIFFQREHKHIITFYIIPPH